MTLEEAADRALGAFHCHCNPPDLPHEPCAHCTLQAAYDASRRSAPRQGEPWGFYVAHADGHFVRFVYPSRENAEREIRRLESLDCHGARVIPLYAGAPPSAKPAEASGPTKEDWRLAQELARDAASFMLSVGFGSGTNAEELHRALVALGGDTP